MGTWLLPRSDLTPEQLRVVEMSPDQHRVVLGPPGSGKTQVLVHRAAHLTERYKVPSTRYRLFVFTNVVKEYIRSGVQFLGLPEETACTFDHWCRLFYEDYVSNILPRKSRRGIIDFERIRLSVLDTLESRKALQNSFDFVLVDEGQDLSPEVYDILRLAAKHITVFTDPQQKIFENGAPESFILQKLNLSRRNATLLGAYRNAPYVAYLASHFISDEELRKEYIAQTNTEQKVRERPLCYIAPSFEDETNRLAEIVKQRQIMNERVGIIVPTNRLLHGLAKGLEERGIELEKAIKKESFRGIEVACDFGNNVPKIATFHMAKGLTFDSVLMPRLIERSFPWVRGVARQRILFVGIARATQWVYLSTINNYEISEMEILRKAEAEGHLVIQERDDFRAREEEPEDDDFSVL